MKKFVVAAVVLSSLCLFRDNVHHNKNDVNEVVDYRDRVSFPSQEKFSNSGFLEKLNPIKNNNFAIGEDVLGGLEGVLDVSFNISWEDDVVYSGLIGDSVQDVGFNEGLFPPFSHYLQKKVNFERCPDTYLKLKFFWDKHEKKSPVLKNPVKIDSEVLSLLDVG